MLQNVLTEYLEVCIDELNKRFTGKKKAELEMFQHIYQSVDPDSSAYHAVVTIRELEQEQFYKNQVQPDKSE